LGQEEQVTRGGAPPKIDIADIADRFGPKAVELTELLYQLRSEAGLTNVDVAARWAKLSPQECRDYKVLTSTGEIERRRLTEVLQWRSRPIPAGLIKAYLDLWIEALDKDKQQAEVVADKLRSLYRAVRQAGAPQAKQSSRAALTEQIITLQDKLLQTQEALFEATKERATFQVLVWALLRIVQNLQNKKDALVASAADAEQLEPDTALHHEDGLTLDALPRARAQVALARRKAGDANQVAIALTTQYHDLLAQVRVLNNSIEPAPLAGNPVPAATPALPDDHSIEQYQRWLDQTEAVLHDRSEQLDHAREALDDPGSAATDSPPASAPRSLVIDAGPGHGPDTAVAHSYDLRTKEEGHSESDYPDKALTSHNPSTTPDNPNLFPPAFRWVNPQVGRDRGTQQPESRHGQADAQTRHDAPVSTAKTDEGVHRSPQRALSQQAAAAAQATQRHSQVKRPPHSGWRRTLHSITGGLVNLGESAADIHHRELITRINQPLRGCYKVATLSLKGGVGKTTITTLLGSILASLREHRVIAVDADPDRGTLSQTIPVETTATVRNLLRDASRIRSHLDIRAYTSQAPSRLEILASEQDPAASEAFSVEDYQRTIALLKPFYNIVLTDCGTSLMHPALRSVLDLADSLVVVSSTSLNGALSASATLDWLDAHGYQDLVTRSVAVINSVQQRSGRVDADRLGGMDLDRMTTHFANRCRTVVRIPFDLHLEVGGEIELDRLGPDTVLALLELGAMVADDFPG